MTTICKADYYYGALLSVLVNGGLAPALFEKENDNRQIYEVTTNKASYIIYTKYNTTPSGSKDFTWSFSFSDNEIEEIIKIHHENNKEKRVYLCLYLQPEAIKRLQSSHCHRLLGRIYRVRGYRKRAGSRNSTAVHESS
jgi:hypothetical protein